MTGVFNALGGTVEELLEGALNVQNQIGLLDRLVSYIILVEVRLYFLNHWHLLTLVVKGNVVGVNSSEESLEIFHWVSTEAVALVLPVWAAILENVFAIAVID